MADDFLSFIGDAPLVIHNAEFDLKFLNAELKQVSKPALQASRAIDTIQIAKRRFPGSRYSLDELCRRFNIDLSVRSLHNAKVDTELLAQVYLELIGGRQAHLQLAPWEGREAQAALGKARAAQQRKKSLPPRLDAVERECHARLVTDELKGDVLWNWGKP